MPRNKLNWVRTVPYISYNTGHRVVVGSAVVSDRNFSPDWVETNINGDEEIVMPKIY